MPAIRSSLAISTSCRMDDIGGSAVALSAAPLRQAKFGMGATNPMDQQDDLGGFIVDIGDTS
jgi:hypothetical protein